MSHWELAPGSCQILARMYFQDEASRTLSLRAFTTEWTALCSEGAISKCAAKILSLVDMVESINGVAQGVAVPDPRVELGAIVAQFSAERCIAHSGYSGEPLSSYFPMQLLVPLGLSRWSNVSLAGAATP